MFAWTCDESIHFIIPLIGAAIFGYVLKEPSSGLSDVLHSIGFFQVLYGIMVCTIIFLTVALFTHPLQSWTVDSYREYSASALGAAVLVRNLFGAGLPLAGNPMYEK